MSSENPWLGVKRGSDALKRIGALIWQLSSSSSEQAITDNTRLWINPFNLLRFWAEQCNGFLRTESEGGINGSDMVFILMCHSQLRLSGNNNNKATEKPVEILDLASAVRCQAVPIPHQPLMDSTNLFQLCIEALLIHKTWQPSQAVTAAEKAKAVAFGLELGDADDLYEGEEEEERQGEEIKVREKAGIRREAEMDAKKRARFLRWCSRTFLENWFVLYHILPPNLVQDEKMHAQIAQWRPKFDAWCLRESTREPSGVFKRTIEHLVYRQLTGIGAARQRPEMKDWESHFRADDTGTTFDAVALCHPNSAPAILKDEKHAFNGLFKLALAMTMFECLIGGMDFRSAFLVLRDELVERRDWILKTALDQMLPRRPLIIQLPPGSQWVVHHRDTWFACGQGVEDALLGWAFLMQRDCAGQTVAGHRIGAWLDLVTTVV